MKFRYFPLILFLFLCISKAAFGQITTAPGYIINTSGDSVTGQLEYVNTNLSAKRAFISNTSGKLEFLKPEQIQSLYINPEVHFKTLTFKGKKVFMQVVSEGQLNLYEYKGNLFLENQTDSLILLTGGKKTVAQNGKKYAIYDYTYKSQLRNALQANIYISQIEQLRFDKKNIIKLTQEVNGAQNIILSKPELKGLHQFEIRAGFTFSKTILTYIPYQQDTLRKSETFFQDVDVEYLPDEKQKLGNFTAGFLYKKKIGRKYSYLKTGILYNKALKTRRAHTPTMHTRYVPAENSLVKLDTVGWSFDSYTYDLSNLEIPVSYYAELSDGRVRPFFELGLTAKIYRNASVILKREIYDETRLLRTETGKMKLPAFTINPMLGFGCRYLLNKDNSIITGVHLDYYRAGQTKENNNFRKAANMNFYVGFGF